ncbi:MAG: NAD(P)-dependent oxidoreductase, partial [Burkholderiaceae bacterium]
MTQPLMLVTGGSRGIGAATVLLALTRGWRVAFSYRDNAEAA